MVKLYFKRSINDAKIGGKVYMAGNTYEFAEDRAKEILKAVPDAVETVAEREPESKVEDVKPKAKSKPQKKAEPAKVEEGNPEQPENTESEQGEKSEETDSES